MRNDKSFDKFQFWMQIIENCYYLFAVNKGLLNTTKLVAVIETN